MMKRIALAATFVYLTVAPAFAADNAIILTPGVGVTERSKDVGGGVQSVIVIPGDTSGVPLATAPGTGNTVFALPMQGVAGGVAVPVSGTFWPYTLGQQLAASSVPVVLTAAQLTTLTPPTTVTANLGTLNGAATAANQSTMITSLASIATNTGAAIPAGTALIGKVGIDQTTPGTTNGVQVNAALPAGTNAIGSVTSIGSQYPTGAVAITASATGTTAATTATLAGTSGKTTYICSYSIRANATAATTVTDTVTGVITATMSSELWVAPAASGIGVDEQIFSPCVPASATNTGIAVVSGAPGTGGIVSVHATGYQL